MAIERVCWDTVCVISRIQKHPDRSAVLQQWTDRAERGEIEIVCSTFALIEVAKGDINDTEEEQVRKIVEFFDNPYIVLQQVDERVARLAREFVRDGLKPKDAVHVASAISSRSEVLHTYDVRDLIKRSGRYGNPPLRIAEPEWRPTQLSVDLLGKP